MVHDSPMNPRFIPAAVSALAVFFLTLHSAPAQTKKSEERPKGKRPPVTEAPAPVKAPKSVTRYYHIPPTFTIAPEETGKGPVDPFSDMALAAGSGEVNTLRMTYLKAGIELNTNDSVSYDRGEEILTVTTSLQTHRQFEKYFAILGDQAEKQFHILVEFIEVNHLDFSDWMLENRLSGDGTPLRKEVQEWVREEEATILESSMVTARSGQRAKVESISEYIYPTEYDPPEVPDTLTQGKDSDIPVAGVTPTAFETRNLGVTFEVDPVLGRDQMTIDLNLAPEIVQLEGFTTWANEDVDEDYQVSMPTFYTMKTTTQVTLIDGKYAFLSTLRPLEPAEKGRDDALVLLFVRADVGSLGQWSVSEAE